VPLLEGSDQETIDKNVAELIASGKPRDQAVAIAMEKAGKRKDAAGPSVYRIDRSGTVRTSTPTPQGGMRVDAYVRKVGILEYPEPSGNVRREFVPPEELTHADSIASLRAAPVTNRHPPGAVTRKNYRQFAAGHVDGDGRMDGDHLGCALVIQADDALGAVESGGVREVSAGYTCTLDPTPGIWQGQRYDAIQREIRYNHVALVPQGRAGASVRLRLDSNGDTFEEIMSDTLQKDLDAAKAEIATLKARADAAEAGMAKERARADAAEAGLKARADADELAAVVEAAKPILGKDWKADGKDATAIKAEVIGKVYPTLKLDGAEPAYVQGLFVAAQNAPRADASVAEQRTALRAPPAPRTDAKPDPRAELIKRTENAWKRTK